MPSLSRCATTASQTRSRSEIITSVCCWRRTRTTSPAASRDRKTTEQRPSSPQDTPVSPAFTTVHHIISSGHSYRIVCIHHRSPHHLLRTLVPYRLHSPPFTTSRPDKTLPYRLNVPHHVLIRHYHFPSPTRLQRQFHVLMK